MAYLASHVSRYCLERAGILFFVFFFISVYSIQRDRKKVFPMPFYF